MKQSYVPLLGVISLFLLSLGTAEASMVGGDRDEHGCNPSAGYSWNTITQKCERPWEQKEYTDSYEFLRIEGFTCKQATDGCNTVGIVDGKLGAMTEMYCEDIYGKNGQEKWSCLDTKIADETLGFLSDNDRNYYETLATRIDDSEQERVVGIISNYGDKILEKYTWNISQSEKAIEKTVSIFEKAIYELAMQTPADAAMNEHDSKIYNLLNYAKFELQIMMNRWIRNSGMTK